MMKSVKKAGKDTSSKGYVLLFVLLAVIVIPHVWEWLRTVF